MQVSEMNFKTLLQPRAELKRVSHMFARIFRARCIRLRLNSWKNWVGTRANPPRPAFEIGTRKTRRWLQVSRTLARRSKRCERRHGARSRGAGNCKAQRLRNALSLSLSLGTWRGVVPSIARSGYGNVPSCREILCTGQRFENFVSLEILVERRRLACTVSHT